MIEVELFYNLARSSIRDEQAAYLKKQRSQPFAQELPDVEEISAEAYAKLTLWQKIVYRLRLRKQRKAYKKALKQQKVPMEEQLTRGYNAGIELALRALEREFDTFSKRLAKENKGK